MQIYSSIISPKVVNMNLGTANWRFLDCRFDLAKPLQKQSEFSISHLPKASYVNLENDLSAAPIIGKTGRHPLPEIKTLIEKFSLWGINSFSQVVVYDDCGGAHAARLWWILQWLGHNSVAVLDGGWHRWIKENRPISKTVEIFENSVFNAKPRNEWFVNAEEILDIIDDEKVCIFDARSFERFKGDNETIDPIGGHIPGAVSVPFYGNLDKDGNWKSKSELRQMYLELLKGFPVEQTISYCGSGITACHNILAIYHAGLGFSRLYPGSWSDWINNSKRPVSIG